MITLTRPRPFTYSTFLTCSNCGMEYSLSAINTYATCCNQPLVVEYEPSHRFHRTGFVSRRHDMWRYTEMLPVLKKENIVSLGEGMTPIFSLNKLADRYGFSDLLM